MAPYSVILPFDPAEVPDSQKLKLTLDSSVISTDQTDFPLTVVLNGTDPLHAAVFDELGSNSKKLSIQSGATQLPVEIEHWDSTAEKAVLHTKVPTYAAAVDGELILSYDSSRDDNDDYVGVTGSATGQSVWDSNFSAVYHLAQDPSGGAGCILDSTANGHHGTPTGMTSGDLVEGYIGKGLDFDRTDDIITLPAGNSILPITTNYTIEAAAKLTTEAAGTIVPNRIFSIDTTTLSGALAGFGVDNGKLSFSTYTGSFQQLDGPSYTTGQDHVSAVTKNGTTHTLFHDGAAHGTTLTATPTAIGSTPGYISYDYAGSANNRRWLGVIRELRVSSVARSADWLKLTHLSLTDQLIIWSAYAEEVDGEDLAAHLIQRYNLTDPLDTWLSQPYGLAVALSAHLEQPYSFLLQAYLIQHYGDARQLRAWLIQKYGNVPQLRAWLEQRYEDPHLLSAWLEQPWNTSHPLLTHLSQRYGIAAGKLQTFVAQLYALHEHPQLANHLLQPYLVGDLARTTYELAYEVTIGGVPVSPHVINWDFRRSRYYGTIELTLKEQAEALLAVDGAELAFSFGGSDYSFFIEDGWEETSGWAALSYRVQAHSKTKRLGSPHATPITGTVGPGMASEIFAALIAPYGITLNYEIADVYLDAIEAQDEAPIDLIRRILPDEAVLQSGPEGDVLYIQWETEVAVPLWFSVPPAATIDDLTGFMQTSETGDRQPGYNRIDIIDQQTAEDQSQLVQEQIDGQTIEVRQYLSPWDDAIAFELKHTAGSHVSIEPFGVVTRSVTETVEVVDGSGRTQYPIDAVIATAWKAADLGAVTADDEGIIEAAVKRTWDAAHETYSGGDSLLAITYRTRFWRWLVRSPRIDEVQVIALRGTAEELA